MEMAVKLSELVSHTNNWLGIPHTVAASYARALREARAISVGTTGGGAAEMNITDKLTLLMAIAGCSTARTSADIVPGWFEVVPYHITNPDNFDFHFLKEPTLHKALFTLMAVDLDKNRTAYGSGKLHDFVVESMAEADARRVVGNLHNIRVEFAPDFYAAEITILRDTLTKEGVEKHQVISAFYHLSPYSDRQGKVAHDIFGFAGIPSPHIFRLTEPSLRGWATCLVEAEGDWVDAPQPPAKPERGAAHWVVPQADNT